LEIRAFVSVHWWITYCQWFFLCLLFHSTTRDNYKEILIICAYTYCTCDKWSPLHTRGLRFAPKIAESNRTISGNFKALKNWNPLIKSVITSLENWCFPNTYSKCIYAHIKCMHNFFVNTNAEVWYTSYIINHNSDS